MSGYWEAASRVCTAKELEALRLRDERGMSPHRISMALGLSRRAVRERLDNADRKIALAMRTNDQETAA